VNFLERARYYFPDGRLEGLPRRYHDATVDALPASAVRTVTEAFLADPLPHLEAGRAPVYLGRARQYKTFAAAAVAAALNQQYGLSALWVNVPSVLGEVQRNRFSDGTSMIMDRIKRVPLVIMDDFAAVKSGSFEAGVLVEICATRFDALLPTIWTGNVVPDKPHVELAAQYGPSLARRLADTGKGLTAVMA
jgi:hypothetical protein